MISPEGYLPPLGVPQVERRGLLNSTRTTAPNEQRIMYTGYS